MSVVVARPPNFELILRAFPNAANPGVIFAYGDDIYNPSGNVIPPPLLAHESVHGRRQLEHNYATKGYTAVDQWWERYVVDPEFRYEEELHAHVAEFRAQDFRGIDRNVRAKLLQSTASRLVAPLYNYTPPRSLTQAIRDIRWGVDGK